MTKEEQEQYDVALLLVYSAERQLTQQKVYEALQGITLHPIDPFVLIKLQSFLSEKGVQERLLTILETI